MCIWHRKGSWDPCNKPGLHIDLFLVANHEKYLLLSWKMSPLPTPGLASRHCYLETAGWGGNSRSGISQRKTKIKHKKWRVEFVRIQEEKNASSCSFVGVFLLWGNKGENAYLRLDSGVAASLCTQNRRPSMWYDLPGCVSQLPANISSSDPALHFNATSLT